jgi:hypothetical protein
MTALNNCDSTMICDVSALFGVTVLTVMLSGAGWVLPWVVLLAVMALMGATLGGAASCDGPD